MLSSASPFISLLSFGSPVLLLFGYVLYYRYLHPLAGYPGPFLASLTGFWKAYRVGVGDFEKALLALHQKHGKIIRIGPDHLDISDASAVKTIYGAGKSFRKRFVWSS